MATSAITDKLSPLTQPSGSVTTYGYDSLERLNSVVNRKSAGLGNALISGYNYGYDNAQHKDARSWVESQVGTNPVQKVNFGYDDVDQLLSEISTETTPDLNKSYGYDAMGNRSSHSNSSAQGGFNTTPQSTSYTANKLNQLLSYTSTRNGSSTTTNLTFDAGGNLTEQKLQGSSNPQVSYAYDDLDRLTQVITRDSNGNYTHKSEYAYDYGNCKAVSREYSWNGTTWVKDSEKRRVYDGMDIVQERDGTNATTANITRDGNIGGILARTTYPLGVATHTFYYYDGSGNVVQLTDSNQNSVAEYSYDAYGVTLTSTGAQAGNNPYRYSTKEIATNGLYDYGFRFYLPGLGRWLNRDPLRENGGLNLYEFVQGSPTNLVDAYGLKPGDKYKIPDEAAIAACKETWPKSEIDLLPEEQTKDMEWGGFILRVSVGKGIPDYYTYSEPKTDKKPGSISLGLGPINAVGMFHTHPEGPGTAPDYFSLEDEEGFKLQGEYHRLLKKVRNQGYGGNWRGYIGTPTGVRRWVLSELKRYKRPKTGPYQGLTGGDLIHKWK